MPTPTTQIIKAKPKTTAVAPVQRSYFEGISKVESTQGGRKMVAGNYTLEITQITYKLSNKDQAPLFIVDFSVVSSSQEDFHPGDHVSWVTKRSKFADFFLRNVKAFIAAAADCDESDIDEEASEAACADDQPYTGTHVRCAVTPQVPKEGKETTGQYFDHKWYPAAKE